MPPLLLALLLEVLGEAVEGLVIPLEEGVLEKRTTFDYYEDRSMKGKLQFPEAVYMYTSI